MNREIDSAKVLAFSDLDDQEVKVLDTKIYGLAICKYSEDSGYYLFYCDKNWNTITDFYFDSFEQAKESATLEFGSELVKWKTID